MPPPALAWYPVSTLVSASNVGQVSCLKYTCVHFSICCESLDNKPLYLGSTKMFAYTKEQDNQYYKRLVYSIERCVIYVKSNCAQRLHCTQKAYAGTLGLAPTHCAKIYFRAIETIQHSSRKDH